MSRVDEILAQLQSIAANPKKAADDFTKETGKGVVGLIYVYLPEEIIHAAGYLPMSLWGAHKPVSKARAYLPPYGCSIMQEIMELECDGAYDFLKAVVFSVPCDTLKCASQMWKGKCPSLAIAHPQNRKLEAANVYLTKEYRNLQAKLEKILGVTISDDAIARSIEVYNDNRQTMRAFCQVAAAYPHIIDPVLRHAVIKARHFMEKSKHTALVKELIAEIRKNAPAPWNGKKVILSGIMAEPDGLLSLFKEFGYAVVDDDLAQESRQFRHDVPAGNDPVYRLAKWWQNLEGCSLATDPTKRRAQMLIEAAKAHDADGVILCQMKFCDPEEFDYPILYPALDAAGVRNLMIEVDLEATSFEQIKTRLQTFTEIISQ